MKRLAGTLLSACVGLLALGFAAPARAADVPELDVIPYQTALGQVAETEIDLFVPKSGAAPAKITIYVPAGYGVNTSFPAGTTIGTVAAEATAGGTTVPLKGTVVTDDPARYASSAPAQACAPGTHAAVWVLELALGSTTVNIPVYVDATTGAETALGGTKLQACLSSPDVPEAQGGAPLGAKLTEVDIDLPKVYTNPSSPAFYRWRALITPYAAGTGTVDAAGTVEVRALAPIPQRLTLTARYDRKRKVTTITGVLLSAGTRESGVNVHVVGGTSPNPDKFKPFATARTKKGGVFSIKRKIVRTTYLWAFVNVYFGSCTGPATVAPGGCVRETISPAFANFLRIVVPKKKR
jgi:hypothetical protein